MQVADGLVVVLEYTVRFDDGVVLDSTGGCGPLAVMIGSGQLFPALEDRILGMEAGETRELEIPPADAYGEWSPDLVRTMRIVACCAGTASGVDPSARRASSTDPNA